MAYVYQSFSSGQVFTKANAQQIEDNIRDHVHGANGIGAAGVSFNPGSATNNFTVTQAYAANNMDLSGEFTVSFNSAGTLGQSFGAGFTNIGSQRIVLQAAAGQFIGVSSIFILTPGEFIGIGSDGSKLKTLGNTTGRFLLHNQINTSSAALNRTINFPWFADFKNFEIQLDLSVVSLTATTSLAILQWSPDSGTNFATAGYHEYTTAGGVSTTRGGVVLFGNPGGGTQGIRTKAISNIKLSRQSNDLANSTSIIMHQLSSFSQSTTVSDYSYLFGQTAMGLSTLAQQYGAAANALRIISGQATAFVERGSIMIWGER
jgi:hypothetical protein